MNHSHVTPGRLFFILVAIGLLFAACKNESRRYYTYYPTQYVLVIHKYKPD